MPFIETSTDAKLHYDHLNPDSDNTPVLLLHGLLGTGRKDLGHVMDWLVASGYPVIAPSLRGYGQSEPKPRDFPYRFYDRDAKDIVAFLDALTIDKVHVLGYSDGGEVALISAGTAPEKFVSVTTIGSTGYFDEQVRVVVQGYRPGHIWITKEEIELHQIKDPDAFSREWQRATIMLVDSGGDVAVNVAPKLTMPVLMMLGERDSLNPRKNADHFLSAGVNQGRVMVFEAGHPVHDEQTEAFQKAFLAHIQASEK